MKNRGKRLVDVHKTTRPKEGMQTKEGEQSHVRGALCDDRVDFAHVRDVVFGEVWHNHAAHGILLRSHTDTHRHNTDTDTDKQIRYEHEKSN